MNAITKTVVIQKGLSLYSILCMLGAIMCAGKAFGFVAYSWWVVTAPFWILPALSVSIAVGAFLLWCVGNVSLMVLDWHAKRRRAKREAARKQRLH